MILNPRQEERKFTEFFCFVTTINWLMEWNWYASHYGYAENGFLVSKCSYFILTVKGKRVLWERVKRQSVVSLTGKLFKVSELMAWSNRFHGGTLLFKGPVSKPFLHAIHSPHKLHYRKSNFTTPRHEENVFVQLIRNFILSIFYIPNI